MSSLLPGLRVAACGKHFIFCVPRAGAAALILAILHERTDIIARLKSRLSGWTTERRQTSYEPAFEETWSL